MASQQQPRPLFRFASMIRPAAAAQPPAPAAPAPAPQPFVRPPVATPFRPPASTTTTTTATTVTTTQPTQPQVPTPQTPARAAPAPPPVAVQPPSPPQPRPQPAVTTPRSPVLAPQPQPVAAASPPPRSPSPVVAPKPVVVSPPKVPSPRSPPVAAPLPRSPVNNVTRSVPQSPFKRASDVTTVSAPTSTPYSSLPPSPKTKMPESIQDLIYQSSSSPSKAPSPPQKVIQPNLVKAQTNSPQIKPAVSHPPSPLKLPPPQLDLESNKIPPQVDQKTVVVQETTMRPNNINGHHHVMQNNRNGSRTVENGKREVIKNDKGVHHHHKKLSNSDTTEDFGMSVLTLAGENKGAIMELSPSRNKYNSPQSLQKKLGSPKARSSSEDESGSESEKAKKRENKMKNKSQLPMTAFMNSNVQGVNNSILHNASCTHHDPGVHLVFSRKTNDNGHGFHLKGSPRS